MVALDRKTVLEVLYNHVKDKSKILLSKRVVSISSSGEKVEVKTDDGSSYAGDMLVGADGIHSKVRSEMWRMARETDPGWLREEEQDRKFPPTSALIPPRASFFLVDRASFSAFPVSTKSPTS